MRWNVLKSGQWERGRNGGEVWPNKAGNGRCGANAKEEKVSKMEPKSQSPKWDPVH